MLKWILVIYLAGGAANVGVDVERIASFETEQQCVAAAQKLDDAFDTGTAQRIRSVCLNGE
jgi:hypothetical protein